MNKQNFVYYVSKTIVGIAWVIINSKGKKKTNLKAGQTMVNHV